ncbi:acyltransferase [Undibacterium sp. TS12]|uniref:acyltransferase family protein n=1 Tax=Undibacterium sp. TS12 TaxID=2908202 RepID=UPI001F4C8860|nr:acyltransferase [Undibacterium sp. TS12]MCH8621011.1 acyltransferase [Undibacterium sp. TS12]
MSTKPVPAPSASVSSIFAGDVPFRLQFLDGLRAVAALWVLWGHCRLFAYGWDSHKSLWMKPLNVLLYLHLGVVVFLVLSGFCLGLPVARNKNHLTVSTKAFFKARAFRILPPYYAALVLILLVNFFVPISAWGRHPTGLTPTISWQILLTNFALIQDFFPLLNTINTPFWSIALEWHLYFLFPLLVWILRRSGGTAFLITGGLLAWGLTATSNNLPQPLADWQMTVLRPPYFLFVFVIGIVSAWFVHGENHQQRMQKKWRVLAPVGLFFLVLFVVLMQRYAIVDAQSVGPFFAREKIIDITFATLVAIFLIWMSSIAPDHTARRFLENKILTRTGSFSYSLYLVHIPIVAATHHAIESLHLPTNYQHLHFALLVVIGTGASVAFAWVFSRVFETGLWWRLLNRKPGAFQRDNPVLD